VPENNSTYCLLLPLNKLNSSHEAFKHVGKSV
jgi:hypothetical protein